MRLLHAILAAAPACAAMAGDGPTAYVYEHVDQWTKSAEATRLLEEAGFDVEPLPLDRSPWLLERDLILIGSFASEDPAYADYMAEYADDLFNYVDKGHTLLQLTQADQVERTPPFLPTTQGASRNDLDAGAVRAVSEDSPPLRGIDSTDGVISFSEGRTSWETFDAQGGFEVMLEADVEGHRPVLMEGAYGQGRIILCSMALDKANMGDGKPMPEAFDAFRARFFANLAEHVVNVRNVTTEPLDVTPSAMFAARFVPGSWTLAVLPDTQVYALRFPGLFSSQTAWIAQNRDRANIRYVLHLGDIVNNNSDYEWRNARDAFSLLDGVVPYAIVPGNHDYGPSGDASTRETLMNDYFDYDETASWPTFGGAMEPGRLDNTYHLFDAGGEKWIVIALEWAPRDETVAWANRVMDEHPDRTGILITHAYMNNNDLRYDHTDTVNPQHYNPHDYRTPGPVNDGEELWQKLVRRHDFLLVLNGHVLGDGTGYLVSTNDLGRKVQQMLSNYQMRQLGGEGYLRLLEFRPDGTIQVKSYSTLYDSYLETPDQLFEIRRDPAPASVGAAGGGD